MIRKLKKVLKFKVFYVILALILLVLPTTIYMPSQAQSHAIVTTIGIDKTDDGLYEVTLVLVTPKNGGEVAEGTMVDSGTGQTVAVAMHMLTINLGKELGLQYCNFIIVSDDILLNEDLINVLDYFVRANNLTTDASIINCPKSAKELIEQGASETSSAVESIIDILEYNNKHLYSQTITIYEFYNKYFTESSSVFVPIVEIEGNENIKDSTSSQENSEEDSGNDSDSKSGSKSSGNSNSESGNSSSSNEKGSGSESSGSQSTSSKLKSNGKCAIIKNGKKIREITEHERMALNFLSKDSDKGIIGVTHFTEGSLKDANILMQLVHKTYKIVGSFDGDQPKIKFKINMIVKLDEIVMEDITINAINSLTSFMTPKLKEALKDNAKGYIFEFINNLKRDRTDLLSIYDNLNRFHHKKMAKFMDGLQERDAYLSYIDYDVEINIRGKI